VYKTVPTEIDHNAINRWKVALRLLLMGFEEKDADGQQAVLLKCNQYFSRITEVLEFLVYVRGIDNIKSLLPKPFFLPNIYDRTHLALQRSGSKYDGKYYILDIIRPNEGLVTEMRQAELEDIRWALIEIDEIDGLESLIWQLDQQTSDTSRSTP